MEKSNCRGFKLTADQAYKKTTNSGGQSNIDCEACGKNFEKEKFASRISSKISDEIYAVYFDYTKGDLHRSPFRILLAAK